MLNELKIKGLKPKSKDYKIGDRDGMYMLIKKSGGMLWHFRYRFDGKQKTLSIGAYPEISLANAREKLLVARKILANGIDPSQAKQDAKAARYDALENNFECVAREYLNNQLIELSENHVLKTLRRAELYLFPHIGKLPIADITTLQILNCLDKVKKANKLETAHRVLQLAGQIYRYAIQRGKCKTNPTTDLKGALPAPTIKHMASITEPKQVADYLRSVDAFKGTIVVESALKLAPLVFVRPGELRKAKWNEIDLENKEWRYFVTKTKVQHLVPLSNQAIRILVEIKKHTGNREHVFTGGRDPKKCMSEAAINAALQRMGYNTQNDITGHGFRAMARTMIAERLKVEPQIIEHQLAHAVSDALGTAYNRTKFIEQRTLMMQEWADYLDELKTGAKVLDFKSA